MECPYCGNETEGVIYPLGADDKLEHDLEELAIRFEEDKDGLIERWKAGLEKQLFDLKYGERLESFTKITLRWAIPASVCVAALMVLCLISPNLINPFEGARILKPYFLHPSKNPTALLAYFLTWFLLSSFLAQAFVKRVKRKEEQRLRKDFNPYYLPPD